MLGSEARVPPLGVAQPSRRQRLPGPDGRPMTDWQDGCAYCDIAELISGAACARHGFPLFGAVAPHRNDFARPA